MTTFGLYGARLSLADNLVSELGVGLLPSNIAKVGIVNEKYINHHINVDAP